MEQREDHSHDYSTLEVDHSDSSNLPEANRTNDLPQVRPTGDYPEVFDNGRVPGDIESSTKGATICGLRRTAFWLTLLVALLVIIAVGVGSGVGTAKAHKATGASNVADNAAASGGNSISKASQPGRIASFSRLAAVNYTDRQERHHYQVYYQDNNLDLWMADFDTSVKTWNFTKTNTTGMDPKNGTAITAYNWPWAGEPDHCDFHMRFISTSNKIRALYGRDELLSDPWASPGKIDGNWDVTGDSSLVLHGGECGSVFCDGDDVMVFRSANGGNPVVAAFPYLSYSFGPFLPGDVVADRGTAFAKAPIPVLRRSNVTFPRKAMYMSANNGSLKEMYYAYGKWTVTQMSVPDIALDAGSQMTAMSNVSNDLLYVQVLVTRKAGGVMMAYLDGGPEKDWASNASVAGMEKVLPLSPIAAAQTGHVYALEEGDGGPELVEWMRTSETGTPTFERVGIVNPTAAVE